MDKPLGLVLVGSFGNSGDQRYRLHQPAAALARLAGVDVHEVHPQARSRDAAALAADVLVLLMGMDVELLRLAHQRRQLGRPTVLEVNDWLPGVQRCNPVHANWSDARAWHLLTLLMEKCDAVQVSSEGLAQRLAPLGQKIQVIANQLPSIPPLQKRPICGPLRIGWGGSAGHFDDIAAIAPALVGWLKRHNNVQLEVMGDPVFKELFEQAPAARFHFIPAGSLDHYLRWLEDLHIGLAPLQPSDYNHCRSDVKFLEYASRGVVPVLQRCPTYSAICEGETGLLFDNTEELLTILDHLIADPDRCQNLAASAYDQVRDMRLIDKHAPQQLDFYRHLLWNSPDPQQLADEIQHPFKSALIQAGATPLKELRQKNGWRQISSQHWQRDLTGAAEHQLLAGVEAMGQRQWTRALQHLRQSTAADPSDPYALVYLGQVLERLGRPGLAQNAYERAANLDPLSSRPRRSLAALHQRRANHWAAAADALNPLPLRNPGKVTQP